MSQPNTIMKVNQIKVHLIDAASAAALETAITTWVQGLGEATFIGIDYQVSGSSYSVLVTYTL
jgi:hypothetical protein